MAKAFDCVDRKLLLNKLEKLGIRGRVFDLFNTYLNNRSQIVQINNTQSKIYETKYNVAQGSKLGPLMFLIFMNDFFLLKLNGSLQLYADDSSITYISDNFITMKGAIDEDLKKIGNWFKNNLLIINADKTKILIFKSKKDIIDMNYEFEFNGSKIQKIDEMKYLGLTIDSELNWNSHIQKIIKKIKPYIGIFRRISFLCNDDVKKLLYYSFFQSHITYLLTLWSGTTQGNIDKIKVLQNKCLRNLFYNEYRDSRVKTNDIYNKHEIMSFDNLINFDLNTNIYKICNNKLKADIVIEKNENQHSHLTRQAKKLRKIKCKNKHGELSIINRCISKYNKLNSPLKNITSCDLFKRELKKQLLERQLQTLNLIKKKGKKKNNVKKRKKI